MSTIPNRLKYNSVRPPGLPGRISTQKFLPPTGVLSGNDIIRFMVNSTGFWDPYTAYINIDVDFSGGDPGVIYQIDNSAQSFIRSLTIFNKGTEIERIQEYDTLAAILYDLNYPIHKRMSHTFEGVGYSNYSNQTYCKTEGGLSLAWRPLAHIDRAVVRANGYYSNSAYNTSSYPAGYYQVDPFTGLADGNHNSYGSHLNDDVHTDSGRFAVPVQNYSFDISNSHGLNTQGRFAHGHVGSTAHLNSEWEYQWFAKTDPTSWRLPIQFGLYTNSLFNPSGDNDPRVTENTSVTEWPLINKQHMFHGIDTSFGPIRGMNRSGRSADYWKTGPHTPVASALFRQNGTEGIDVLGHQDYMRGATNKQLFNYPLSNSSFEPMFTSGWRTILTTKTVWYATSALSNACTISNQPGGESGVVNIAYPNTDGWKSVGFEFDYTVIGANEPVPVAAISPTTALTTPVVTGGATWTHMMTTSCSYIWTQHSPSRPTIIRGKPARSPCTTGSFSIPLLSGVFGHLMPTTSYKLLPMKFFPDLCFEFQISPYAVFTSGYSHRGDNAELSQPKRKFQITRMELIADHYIFDPRVEQAILSGIERGFTLHTHSWMVGPSYNIMANQIPGTIQLNLGFDSLKSLIFCFIPLDYQKWSWCRKQYRLSHNLTKLHAKVGMDFYPNQPINAHAGNLQPRGTNSTQLIKYNNNEYIIQLLKAFGKYGDITEDTFINPVNFAINDRIYDPDSQPGVTSRNGNPFSESHNQYGMPLLHENRCVGRAVYGLDFETMSRDASVLSGVSTTSVRPFEVYLEYDADISGTFKGASQMYPFLWYDFMLEVTPDGIKIIGRS